MKKGIKNGTLLPAFYPIIKFAPNFPGGKTRPRNNMEIKGPNPRNQPTAYNPE